MRQTPLPLLRDLAPGALISRCEFCRSFAVGHEACQGSKEASQCPPRRLVDVLAGTWVLEMVDLSGQYGKAQFGSKLLAAPCEPCAPKPLKLPP